MSDRCCENCKFWDPSCSIDRRRYGGEEQNRCTVAPPIVDMRSGAGVWPHTDALDYCGSHQFAEPDFSRLWRDPNDPELPF